MKKRIYIVYHGDAEFVRQKGAETAACESYHHATPGAAWTARMTQAAESGVALEASRYIAVGADLTGERNNYGAHVCRIDWSDAHPCELLEVR